MINNLWAIHKTKEETEKVFQTLSLALAKKDKPAIIKILQEPINGRSFVIRRGLHCEYLKALKSAFEFLILTETRERDFLKIKDDVIIDAANKLKMPERIYIELISLAYHFREPNYFFKIFNIISNNKIIDQEAVAYGFNTRAVWAAEVEHNQEENIEINKRAMAIAKKLENKIIEQKIIFGLSEHKGSRRENKLKPRKRLDDFRKIADRFRALGDDYDAIRADIELAYVYIELALIQPTDEREKSLNKALAIAKEAQRQAREIGYISALIQSKEALNQVYLELNNQRQALRYGKEAFVLRENYAYIRDKNN